MTNAGKFSYRFVPREDAPRGRGSDIGERGTGDARPPRTTQRRDRGVRVVFIAGSFSAGKAGFLLLPRPAPPPSSGNNGLTQIKASATPRRTPAFPRPLRLPVTFRSQRNGGVTIL